MLKEQGIFVKESNLSFGGEDFAYYLANCPGSFWYIGAKGKECTSHHTATFNPDESVLHRGVAFWLLLAHTPYKTQRTDLKEVATSYFHS